MAENNSLEDALRKRDLPILMKFRNGKDVRTEADFSLRREEIRELLLKHAYGMMPKKPLHLTVIEEKRDVRFLAGKAPLRYLKFTLGFDGGEFSFPVKAFIPKSEKKVPVFIFLSFSPEIPNQYFPCEEIADNGFAAFSICYTDVTSDDENMRNGIAKYLIKSSRTLSSPGKITMWAYAAIRVMDYVESLTETDAKNVAVIGHSQLGKAALVAGAFDERFKYVISNGSGSSGAAISRKKKGEDLADITDTFPFWFCKRYRQYANNETALPFDQHFLLSLIAPRHLLIGNAIDDEGADPESEFLSLVAANEAYEIYGMDGLLHKGEFPKPKSVLSDGNASYHVRHGIDYLSREDWKIYMDFIKSKFN